MVSTTNPEPDPKVCPLGSFLLSLSASLLLEGCFSTLVMYTTAGLEILCMLTMVFSSDVRPRDSSNSVEGMEILPFVIVEVPSFGFVA